MDRLRAASHTVGVVQDFQIPFRRETAQGDGRETLRVEREDHAENDRCKDKRKDQRDIDA